MNLSSVFTFKVNWRLTERLLKKASTRQLSIPMYRYLHRIGCQRIFEIRTVIFLMRSWVCEIKDETDWPSYF